MYICWPAHDRSSFFRYDRRDRRARHQRFPPSSGKILTQITAASEWLLAHGVSIERMADMPSVRHGRLMRALQDADWAKISTVPSDCALHCFLREHVGDATLIVLGCALHSVQRSSWLSRLLHRPTSAQVPLQWLLLLEATRISLDTVLLRTIPAQVSETLRECAVDGVTRQPVIAASREQGTAFRWETLSAPIQVPCRNPFLDVFNPDETGRLGRKPLREGHYLIDCKSCGFAYFWNQKIRRGTASSGPAPSGTTACPQWF